MHNAVYTYTAYTVYVYTYTYIWYSVNIYLLESHIIGINKIELNWNEDWSNLESSIMQDTFTFYTELKLTLILKI